MLKMNDFVEIYPCIAPLQPLIFEDESIGLVKKTRQQFGQIVQIDGAYIYVRPKDRSWETQCYEEELRKMTVKEYKNSKNYARPRETVS